VFKVYVEYCGSFIVVYKYNGSVVDMLMEFCKVYGSVIVVCEYDRSVVDVYGDE
jgi:hypothetical protein